MAMRIALQVLVVVAAVSARQINFRNNCGKTIWVSPLTNAQGPVLGGGVQQVNAGMYFDFSIISTVILFFFLKNRSNTHLCDPRWWLGGPILAENGLCRRRSKL